jgi:hypothetical protein
MPTAAHRWPNGPVAFSMAAALCLAGRPAPAATPAPATVTDLRGECEATVAFAASRGPPEAEVPGVRCFSYLEGMAHVLNLNCRLERLGRIGGAVPAADAAGAGPADLVRAFLAWAARHPEAAGEHESVGGIAIVEAFPCAAPPPPV